MSRMFPRFRAGLGALALLITVLLPVSARAARGSEPVAWTYAIPNQAPMQMDLPSSWTESGRDAKNHTIEFKPTDGARAELTLQLVWKGQADPSFNGQDALRDLVGDEGHDLLDRSVESRLALKDLRGPESTGYYFTLREIAPRKKWALFTTRGAVGLGNLLVRFTLLTGQANMPETRQALKMLASGRQGEIGTHAAPPHPETKPGESDDAEPGVDRPVGFPPGG